MPTVQLPPQLLPFYGQTLVGWFWTYTFLPTYSQLILLTTPHIYPFICAFYLPYRRRAIPPQASAFMRATYPPPLVCALTFCKHLNNHCDVLISRRTRMFPVPLWRCPFYRHYSPMYYWALLTIPHGPSGSVYFCAVWLSFVYDVLVLYTSSAVYIQPPAYPCLRIRLRAQRDEHDATHARTTHAPLLMPPLPAVRTATSTRCIPYTYLHDNV